MSISGRGALVVLEGCDRAGKSTQGRLLLERIRESGGECELLAFPDRTTDLGRFIDRYLKGEVEMEPKEAHLVFAANRQAVVEKMKKKLQSGSHLIVDRYAYSGIAYTLAKKGCNMGIQWAKLHDVGILRPDCVIFFDLSPSEAAARCGFGGERLEALELQERVYEVMKQLGEENKDIWKAVDASLTVSTLADKIWSLVESVMKSTSHLPLHLIDTVPSCCSQSSN
ncbi:unnamed protein product [Enterobius vermicularis]|uniref:Thymidylate kinase n=1 Tax=Enterobius vermicularis TaxID=51028 RepID=A0A0N4VKF1_ENTVE|nr:unnamed protein product [Enterobius vermicularis]